jgi:small GTP-binding protein
MMTTASKIVSKKMCLIGDFAVGKTSLIRQFVERQFSDEYLSTVGVKISRKTVEITPRDRPDKIAIQLMIWDIEGSTKFKAIAPNYLQGATGALIVADATRPETITHLTDHIQLFNSINPKGCIVLALNKSDLIEPERLEKILKTLQGQVRDNCLGVLPTSAKTGIGVDEIFQELACGMAISR